MNYAKNLESCCSNEILPPHMKDNVPPKKSCIVEQAEKTDIALTAKVNLNIK